MDNVELTIDQTILRLMHRMESGVATRESALLKTKLQEALMWWQEHEKARQALIKNSGVVGSGPT